VVLVTGVEGKVEEPFGSLIGDQSALSAGQRQRLQGLAHLLGCATGSLLELRYQLFHRSAAALFEADRYGADMALMLVYSFSPTMTRLCDFAAFARAGFGDDAMTAGTIFGPKKYRWRRSLCRQGGGRSAAPPHLTRSSEPADSISRRCVREH